MAWSPLTIDFSSAQGLHELVIRVDNIAEGHPLFRERYDFYGFGGIFDHVRLDVIQEHEIRELRVLPLDHTTGEVEIQIETTASELKIAFDGKLAGTYPNEKKLRFHVPDFKVWSPDSPNLHCVTVNEKTVEFGIRTLDWSGKRLLLNGEPVKLIGVNRHESHPEFGAATPESLIFSDLQQIRNAGFNCIRGCHYPQREYMLKVCDHLGLMVWEEPLSWGNFAEDLADPLFAETLKEQLKLTIRTSFNHPSLIIHGFLNECASETEEARKLISELMEICHREDRIRPASFASNRPIKDRCFEFSDIVSMNVYPGWYGTQPLSEIPAFLKDLEQIEPGKPHLVTEIGGAAIYGEHSGAPWSEEYQAELVRQVLEFMKGSPEWSGVFFWLFCDANTYTRSENRLARPRCFNNKGFLNEYRKPKLAWNTVREILKKGNISA